MDTPLAYTWSWPGIDVAAPEPLPATGRAVGVDLGVTDFAVARCQQESANRAKAKEKVARAHRKVRAARAAFLHETSTRLIRTTT